jgi:hypothetical protein
MAPPNGASLLEQAHRGVSPRHTTARVWLAPALLASIPPLVRRLALSSLGRFGAWLAPVRARQLVAAQIVAHTAD